MKVLDEVSEVENLLIEEKEIEGEIDHLLWHKNFITNTIEGKILGKRGPGIPKKPYLEDINSSSYADW